MKISVKYRISRKLNKAIYIKKNIKLLEDITNHLRRLGTILWIDIVLCSDIIIYSIVILSYKHDLLY